jgi:hypothetical protein
MATFLCEHSILSNIFVSNNTLEQVNTFTSLVCIISISCEDGRTFHTKIINSDWRTELAGSDLD